VDSPGGEDDDLACLGLERLAVHPKQHAFHSEDEGLLVGIPVEGWPAPGWNSATKNETPAPCSRPSKRAATGSPGRSAIRMGSGTGPVYPNVKA
jgi:hypothetical protein